MLNRLTLKQGVLFTLSFKIHGVCRVQLNIIILRYHPNQIRFKIARERFMYHGSKISNFLGNNLERPT